MHAAIYCRISREDQSTYSLETQEAACRQLAEREGYNVREVFIDDGYPSWTLQRPALDQLRDLTKTGTIQAVIVYCDDRWVRGVGLTCILNEDLKRDGVKLLFVNGQQSDTPEGRFSATVQAAVAELELEKIRERTRRGKRARAHAGLPLLGYGVPFGFQYIPVSKDSRGSLNIDPIEAEVVKEIFQLRLQGIGSWRIAKLLTMRGVKTKHGKTRWAAQTVTKMLRNRVYIGKLSYGKIRYVEPTKRLKPVGKNMKTGQVRNPREEWISLQAPAIIDVDTFNAVQAMMANSFATNPRRRKHEYMFTAGRLRCACSRAMSGYYDARYHRRRYLCIHKNHPHCGRTVSAEWIEAWAWGVVELLMELDPTYLEMELKRRAQTYPSKYRQEDLDTIVQKLREVEKKRQRWQDAYVASVINLAEFAELRAGLDREESELQTLRSEIEDELGRQTHRDQEIHAAVEFITRVRHEIPTYTLAEKTRVVEMLNLRVIYKDRENCRSTFYLPAEWGLNPAEVFGDSLNAHDKRGWFPP
jgi:site-specific DNA recombinase